MRGGDDPGGSWLEYILDGQVVGLRKKTSYTTMCSVGDDGGSRERGIGSVLFSGVDKVLTLVSSETPLRCAYARVYVPKHPNIFSFREASERVQLLRIT